MSDKLSVSQKASIGACAGFVEALLVQPLIFAKVIKQSNGSIMNIIRTDGVTAVYRGTAPFVSQMIPKYFVRFYTYEGTRKHLGSFPAGLIAGAMESIMVICPFENIKTKMQTDAKQYTNISTTLRICFEKRGIGGIYSGLYATIMRQSINQASNFTTYAYLKKKNPNPTTQESMIMGTISGSIGPILNNPIDVIKTRLQNSHYNYGTTSNAIKTMYKVEGIPAFYKGFFWRLLRVAPGQGIIFGCYETLSRMMK